MNAVFKGEFIKPSKSIKFRPIVFDAGDQAPELEKLKIGLVVEAEMLNWVIRIQVYEKQRDDQDRGPVIDKKS